MHICIICMHILVIGYETRSLAPPNAFPWKMDGRNGEKDCKGRESVHCTIRVTMT